MSLSASSFDFNAKPQFSWQIEASTAQTNTAVVAVDPINNLSLSLVLEPDSIGTAWEGKKRQCVFWVRSQDRSFCKGNIKQYLSGQFFGEVTVLTSESSVPPIDIPSNSAATWIDPLGGVDTLRTEIEASFKAAQGHYFEDGMESTFSREIVRFVAHHGTEAVAVMRDLIGHERVDARAAEEALRWLTHIEHPASYEARRALCEQSLWHSSLLVRDAAALGLAALDDWRSIPALEEAIARETCPALRGDMEEVLDQLLEARSRAVSPQENP